MYRDHYALICLLAVGLLMIAPLLPGGSAHAGPQACAEALPGEVDRCGAHQPDPSGPSCQIPCPCASALPGEAPPPSAAEADRLPTPAVLRLAELAPHPDPLPPKSAQG